MTVKKKPAIKIGIITAIAIVAGLIWHFGISSSALFDSDKAVHIDPDIIEDSTLIIGTHLIYIHSLNDEIYNIALDSASASGQEKMYYKSELAGGLWFDITDATSLKDISTAGVIAENSEIAELDMTHHTRSDGITYDLRTNQPVCIFDINDVYDLENMPELEALKMQYDTMKESGSKSKMAKRNLALVQNFFAMSVKNDVTERCDTQINALQRYYQELVANNASSSETEMVLKVMEKVDNTRKAAVFTLVDNGLSTLQDSVADVSDEDDDNAEMDDTLITAIGNSQYSLGESMSEAEGNMLAKGDTVMSETEYTLSNNMISNAESSNYSGCDTSNYKLQYLDNISNGRIVDRTNELELLEEMIDSADIKYGVGLSSGVTAEYNELVARSASNAALQNRIKEDVVNTNAIRGELQFLIQGKTDRMESKEAQSYVLERIQDAAKFKTVIKTDAYESSLRDNVSLYVEWLNDLLKNVKSEGTSQTKSESLYEQKADLQEKKLTALDSLDLDTAKRIDAQIEEIDKDIDKLEEAAASDLQDLMSQKAELEKSLEANPQDVTLQLELSRLETLIADSSSDIDDESAASNIMNSKSEILKALADESAGETTVNLVSNNVELLTSMLDSGSPLALEALKEVYNKLLSKSELENISDYKDIQDNIEQAIAESSVNSSLSGEMSVSDVTAAIAESLGIDNLIDSEGNISDEVSDSDLAAVLIALGDFNKKTAAGTSSSSQGSGQNGVGEGNGSGNANNVSDTANGNGTNSTNANNTGNGTNSTNANDSANNTANNGNENAANVTNENSGADNNANNGGDTNSTDNAANNVANNDGSEADGTSETNAANNNDNDSNSSNTNENSNNNTSNNAETDNAGNDNTGNTGTDSTGNENTDNTGTDSTGNDNADNAGTDNAAADLSSGETQAETSQVKAFTDAIISGIDQSGDGIVFQTMKQGNESYVPAKMLAEYIGYRYVWNDTKKNAILSRGRNFYSFTSFRETVENEKGELLYMDNPAGFSGELYVPSSFAEEEFDCYIYDISGTNYSVLVNDNVAQKSQQLLSELLGKGGY
jgi:hypothetical protein